MDLFQETPPNAARGRGAYKWRPVIVELQTNAGVWYRVASDANRNLATYLTKKYGVEAVSRRVEGKTAVWARWNA